MDLTVRTNVNTKHLLLHTVILVGRYREFLDSFELFNVLCNSSRLLDYMLRCDVLISELKARPMA
jgi:hypothetical protein